MIQYLLLIPVLFVIGFLSNASAFLQIDGDTTINGCKSLGGTIETIIVSEKYAQTIDVCKHQDAVLRIVANSTKCDLMEVNFIDPYTNKEYLFGSSCDVPHFCNNVSLNMDTKTLDLVSDNVHYEIRSSSHVCSVEEFVPEEKKLISTITGNKDFKENIEFSIPQQIMSGDFDVTANNRDLPFKIDNTDKNMTVITMDLDFNDTNTKTIEIMSTHAIPEFPIALLVLITALIPIVLFSRKTSFWNRN